MEKSIVFSYYENDLYPENPQAVKYILWSDGTIEKQDNLTNMDNTAVNLGSDVEGVKALDNFISNNQLLIESIPSKITNDEVEHGVEIEIQFRNKHISGRNILEEPTIEQKDYTHIMNLIKLMNEVKTLVKLV